MVRNSYAIGPTLQNILVYGLNVSVIARTTVGGQVTRHKFDSNTKVLLFVMILLVFGDPLNPTLLTYI